MIAFKSFRAAHRVCLVCNSLPGVRMMVRAVPQGWIITKAKGVNNG